MAKSKKKNPLIYDALVMSLGLMDMTRNKVEKLVSEATKGISKQDKKKAVNRLFKFANDARKSAKDAIFKQIRQVLDDLESKSKKRKSKKKRG